MNIGYNPHLGYEVDVIRDYEKMVCSVANKYRSSLNAGIDYEDLISVGTIGLIKAFRNYDPDRFNGKVTSFSTYAFPMIKWSIQLFLREKRYSVRVPRSIQDKLTTILKQGWEQGTAEYISKMSGWSISEVEEAKQFLEGWSVASLDQTVSVSSKNVDEVALLNLIPSTDDFSGVDVQEFISYLSHIEKTVLLLRIEGITQSDIAGKVRLSQVQVSRILLRIGDKYLKFQSGNLKKETEEIIMSRPRKVDAIVPENNSIEWFVDEGVPTNPTVGINAQGIHLNRRAAHAIGCKAGQCLQIGFDSTGNKLLIRVGNNGMQLREISGDKNGSLRLVNKRLASWLNQKKVPTRRYNIHSDQSAGCHYILLDHYA
ncbi:sigma-70 family RNA polymerase sigma factor [Paenibacillus sp. FSL K6-2524]|uniref:sigma-70 family RNA polymerase sigma factor n=1 Tax=Paenibacillus sp. FSL K6-2524 TaxID=2954516 RepID=UPI0030F80D49